ncbi:hypothetical protein O9992_01055 [Vibrio lentus]|nr:hypothetical protein [Vibrio lentus]
MWLKNTANLSSGAQVDEEILNLRRSASARFRCSTRRLVGTNGTVGRRLTKIGITGSLNHDSESQNGNLTALLDFLLCYLEKKKNLRSLGL